MLDALGRSEYVGEHEYDLVDAAVAPTLEAYADESSHEYDDNGSRHADEARLKSDFDTEREL